MPYVDRFNRICGFLDIEECEGSGRFQRRYFILNGSANSLVWYMDNPQNLPEGATNVGSLNLTYVNKVSDATKMRPKAEFCFVINSGMRRFFLQANDQQDLIDWVEALNNASKITVPRPCTPSSACGNSSVAMEVALLCAAHAGPYRTEVIGGVVLQLPVSQPVVDAGGHSISVEQEKPGSLRRTQSQSPRAVHRESTTQPFALKTGYCVKQGGMMKTWKRRFFVLNECTISYYKSEFERDPLRTILIKDIIKAKENSHGEILRRDNLFEIVTSNRIFYIQTESPEEMHNWIKAISGAIVAQRGPARAAAMMREARRLSKSCLPRSFQRQASHLPLETPGPGTRTTEEPPIPCPPTTARPPQPSPARDPSPPFGSLLLPLHKLGSGRHRACVSAGREAGK
ncbi:pleckstrin homology domain-containing family A member 1 isoform X2 [Lampetra fluviatilis]